MQAVAAAEHNYNVLKKGGMSLINPKVSTFVRRNLLGLQSSRGMRGYSDYTCSQPELRRH